MAPSDETSALLRRPSDRPSLSSSESLRVVSVDQARGLSMLLMILANYQISGKHAYTTLRHSAWFGLTLADTVFPSFVLLCGVSIPLSLSKHLQRAQETHHETYGARLWACRYIFLRIIRRSILLFLFGLWVNEFPFTRPDFFTNFRIMGVLQRFALCYFFNACSYVIIPWRWVRFVLPIALIGMWLVLTFGIYVSWLGCETRGSLEMACCAESFVDVFILTRHHTYNHAVYDPEGFLGTMTASLTMFLGMWIGQGLVYEKNPPAPDLGDDAGAELYSVDGVFAEKFKARERTAKWGAYGYFFLVVGLIMDACWIPIGKPLWTLSFVFVCAGITVGTLTVFSLLSDVYEFSLGNVGFLALQYTRSTQERVLKAVEFCLTIACVPLEVCSVVGRNPLLIYLFSETLEHILRISLTDGRRPWDIMAEHTFLQWFGHGMSSLMWSLAWVVFVFVPTAYFFAWRGWFLRV